MKLDKQTAFMWVAFVVTVVAPVLAAHGYTGELPADLVSLATALSYVIAWAIKKYQERSPQKAYFTL
jgi:hypothetical protein